MSENPNIKIQSPLLYPEIVQKGNQVKVLDTAVNLEWLLYHFNTQIKYNLMTRRREIEIPNYFISPEDSENHALFLVDYLATLNGMPNKKLDNHLDFIAHKYSYHPIVDCLNLKKWDGISRLDKFISTINAVNIDLSKEIIKSWMIGAIAAAFSENGFAQQGVLVLQGEQGIGKTRWVKSLNPTKARTVKEGIFLDPTNKDSITQLSSFWIVELGELDAVFSKVAIGRLKAFITSDSDCLRHAYARKNTHLVRRTAYVATVNESKYLVDTTGNRRWWTIEVTSIDLNHGLDMQQVWAEVYNLWKDGALPYLPPILQSKMNEENIEHERVDPLKEKLLSFYDWSTIHRKWLSASAVLEELGYPRPTQMEATRVGKILTEINGKKSRKSNGLKLHEVPLTILYRNANNLS